MIIGIATIELYLPMNGSLKGKRSVMKPLLNRLRKDFNVSVAEVDEQDRLRTAVIAIACVSADRDYAHGLLTRAVNSIDRWRLDAELVDYEIELIA